MPKTAASRHLTDQEIATIANQALAAAQEATQNFLDANGDRDLCGFAWVTLRPATTRMARWLRQQGVARPAPGGGVQVWNPGGHPTQCITAREQGARAFVKVMEQHGIRALANSRLD